MSKVARLSAVTLIVLTTQALAEAQVYPVGGLGDAWMQNQPSSVGITNGYDPRVQTYLVPGNPPYRVPANTRFQGRAAMAG